MNHPCPRCETPFKKNSFSEAERAYTCRECGYVMRQELMEKGAPRERPAVELPERMTAHTAQGVLTLSRRWFDKSFVVLAVFALLWDAALVAWYTSLFNLGSLGTNFSSVSPILHIAAGTVLTYYALAGLLNRTRITVGDGVVRLIHRPLPWLWSRNLPAANIRQLWTIKTEKVRGEPRFHVVGLLSSGRTFTFLGDLPEPAQALYVEQEIERALHIVDRVVPGEV